MLFEPRIEPKVRAILARPQLLSDGDRAFFRELLLEIVDARPRVHGISEQVFAHVQRRHGELGRRRPR